MSTIITLDPNNDRSQSINQLGMYVYTVKSAGLHTASLAINERPVSGITITVLQNATTVLTTSAPTASPSSPTVTGAGSGPLTAPSVGGLGQQVINARVLLNCAANDTITFTVASATAHDANLNDFKGILNIRQGQV
jgi:hypothetical protein